MISIREIYDILVARKYIKPLIKADEFTDLDFIIYFNNNDITVRNSKIAGVTKPVVRKKGRDLHLFETKRR